MEAEHVLRLFDSCWFELEILKKNPTSSSSSSSSSTSSLENLGQRIEEESPKPTVSRIQTCHNRSTSDQFITSFMHDSLSPDFVLLQPRLQTILSGKQVTETEEAEEKNEDLLPKKNIKNRGRKKKKSRGSKSLSDLEFEELKGFMDLGFVFSEEDVIKDSGLAEIIPGLQRLGKKKDDDKEEEEEEEEDSNESVIQRPYLSEAWKVQNRKKKENPLMNWKVPAMNNENDMKDSLRWWAHTVASTVR